MADEYPVGDPSPDIYQFDGDNPVEPDRAEKNDRKGGAAATYPLQIVKVAEKKIAIRYGTVHGVVPKIGASEITPDLADDANPEISVSASGKLYAKVDLAADTYAPENPILAYAATVPADVDRVSAHQELAAVTYDSGSGAITNIAPVHQGSLGIASCAGVTNYWDLG